MTERSRRHPPRRRRARALLTVAAGALLTGSLAASVVGCGDDGIIANPAVDMSMPIVSNPFDFGPHNYDMVNHD